MDSLLSDLFRVITAIVTLVFAVRWIGRERRYWRREDRDSTKMIDQPQERGRTREDYRWTGC